MSIDRGELESDLIWLLQRNGQRLRGGVDEVAREAGLRGGLRDYIVLTAVLVEERRSQVELARRIGIDKTTLVGVLDRLESQGLIERLAVPGNRRVSVPVATERGRDVQDRVSKGRLAVEAVPGMSQAQLGQLRTLLLQLDAACEEAGMKMTGSCI
ncbi:MarR family winged helix-turn-helix transcriptional regulator [Streptomyces mirabilis]|jgi:DNA-binding MarR family transcriptional regulator|uniref:MarR family protein n=1 Tax=Streptomyces mirabilis TaxID=68239 RepID=A0A1I2XBL8_9ACTN|nr:MarR family transcriptional regulator [Streptomyces mirabilis]SFH10898.1 MarR family protein [Streptomyces mirabilis]